MSTSTRIFTSGQVAKICQVAHATVQNWCSRGVLGHYRLPVGKRDRRIPESDLVKFLAANGMERFLTEDQSAVRDDLLAAAYPRSRSA